MGASDMRVLADVVRITTTNEYIQEVEMKILNRAKGGYTEVEMEPIPDNVCRPKIIQWFREQHYKTSRIGDNSGSYIIEW